ncbi:MAG TPA: hypothetical protein VFZ66_30085 [Herpetosiphonaceae bacterium]
MAPIQVVNASGIVSISAATYSLTFPPDRPFVYVHDAQGRRLAELFVLSSVHPLHDRDDTVAIGAWEIEATPGGAICTLRAQSSVWREKIYRLRCETQRFSYDIEIAGSARLAEVCYFGGYSSGQQRWGSGFFSSGQHFRQGFNPEPNTEERSYFATNGGSRIDLTGVPLPGKGDWFFTPPPFCFAFQGPDQWLALGVEAQPGMHQFTEYWYHGSTGFHLSLAYEGHTTVDGAYRLPAIGFDVGADEFQALAAHVRAARQTLGTPTVAARDQPAWWYEPIFCGWGSQCAAAATERGHAPEYARQPLYESFLSTLAAQDIDPGIVVIDDKWQASYGENQVDARKWPDLRGFIDGQHALGRKVLLWLKAWDAEGVPPAECITNAAGVPLAVDPSHPAYEQRLRESVRRMLAADGYDADGFKIDFTARIPSGPGMRSYGGLWGLELLKRYLTIIYRAAKAVKPNALIMTHTPHPYLADALDMIRLNDAFDLNRLDEGIVGRDLGKTMALRARVAALACPDAIIDTDNWPVRDLATWREYLDVQPELGVPSLYFASHIDLTQELLEAADYQQIRETWAVYREQRTKSNGTTNKE